MRYFTPGSINPFDKNVQTDDYLRKNRLRSFRNKFGKLCRKGGFYNIDPNDMYKDTTMFSKLLSWDISHYFDIWWNPDYKKLLHDFADAGLYTSMFRCCGDHQKYWFDEESVHWPSAANGILAHMPSEWWETKYAKYFDWENKQVTEAFLNHNGYEKTRFEKWWDKFSIKMKNKIRSEFTNQLLEHCESSIETWYSKKLIPPENHLNELIEYDHSKFSLWYTPKCKDILNTRIHNEAIENLGPDNFPIWFDKRKFDYKEGSYNLLRVSSNFFETWWDVKKFNPALTSTGWGSNFRFTLQQADDLLDPGWDPKTAGEILVTVFKTRFEEWWPCIRQYLTPITIYYLQKLHKQSEDEWLADVTRYKLVHNINIEESE